MRQRLITMAWSWTTLRVDARVVQLANQRLWGLARKGHRLADADQLWDARVSFAGAWVESKLPCWTACGEWDAMSEAAQEGIRVTMALFEGKIRALLTSLEALNEEHGGREAAARRISATPPDITAARVRLAAELAAEQLAGPSGPAAAAAGADAEIRAAAVWPGASCQADDADQARTARAFGFGATKGRKSLPDKAAKHSRK